MFAPGPVTAGRGPPPPGAGVDQGHTRYNIPPLSTLEAPSTTSIKSQLQSHAARRIARQNPSGFDRSVRVDRAPVQSSFVSHRARDGLTAVVVAWSSLLLSCGLGGMILRHHASSFRRLVCCRILRDVLLWCGVAWWWWFPIRRGPCGMGTTPHWPARPATLAFVLRTTFIA